MKLLRGLLVFFLLQAGAVFADCVVPQALQELPDGATADKSIMLEAHRRVRDFVDLADQYLACLDAEAAGAGEETEAERQQRIRAYNTVVSQVVTLSRQLEREIAEFNTRH